MFDFFPQLVLVAVVVLPLHELLHWIAYKAFGWKPIFRLGRFHGKLYGAIEVYSDRPKSLVRSASGLLEVLVTGFIPLLWVPVGYLISSVGLFVFGYGMIAFNLANLMFDVPHIIKNLKELPRVSKNLLSRSAHVVS